MLPFLKNQKEGGMSGPIEIEVRSTRDDDDGEYEYLDAIAEDMLDAFESKDRRAMKAALESFCEYIKQEDEELDHEEFEEKE